MPVAMITGSSSGIGRATAFAFAKSGFDVILHAKDSLGRLHQVAQELLTTGIDRHRLICITADVSSAVACKDLVNAAFKWQRTLDVWVNNAGFDVLTTAARNAPFESKLQSLIEVDLYGTIRLSRLVAARMMEATRRAALPSIINIGWDQATLGMEGEPGQLFAPVKSAVMAFTQSFSMTVAPHVRVNCVAPGWIKTEWGQASASNYWDTRACSESTLERWGKPEDVAAGIRWLADPSSEFINGQTLQINGGRRFYPLHEVAKSTTNHI